MEEASISQVIITPWESGGNKFSLKQAKKVYVYGYGIDEIELYGRKHPGTKDRGSALMIQEWTGDDSKQVYNVVEQDIFNEYSLKIMGTGNMVISGLGVEYDELQFAKRKQ
jgi:hypothetical protein